MAGINVLEEARDLRRRIDEAYSGIVTMDSAPDMHHLQLLHGLLMESQSRGEIREFGAHFSEHADRGFKITYNMGEPVNKDDTAVSIYGPRISDKAVFFHTHTSLSKTDTRKISASWYLPTTMGWAEEFNGDIAATTNAWRWQMGGYMNVMTANGIGLYIGSRTLQRHELTDIAAKGALSGSSKRLGIWQVIDGHTDSRGITFVPMPSPISENVSVYKVDQIETPILDPVNGTALLSYVEPGVGLAHDYLAMDIQVFFGETVGLQQLLYGKGLNKLMHAVGYKDHPHKPNLYSAIVSLGRIPLNFSKCRLNQQTLETLYPNMSERLKEKFVRD